MPPNALDLGEVMSKSPLRRSALLWVGSACLGAQDAETNAEHESRFRHQVESLDAVLRRTQEAFRARRIDSQSYLVVLELLLAEEESIAAKARSFVFNNLREGNYWSRGRLKFPTLIRQEWERQRSAAANPR